MTARTPPPKAKNASETARQMSQVFVDVVLVSRFPIRSNNLSITWSHVVRPMAYTTKWGHSVSQVRWSTCLCLNLCNFPYQKHLCSRTPTNSDHQSPILIVIIYLISLTLTLSTHHPPATSGTSDPRRSFHPHFWPRQTWYILLPPPKSVKLPAISWSRSFPLTV